jgi:hypothetical protein
VSRLVSTIVNLEIALAPGLGGTGADMAPRGAIERTHRS